MTESTQSDANPSRGTIPAARPTRAAVIVAHPDDEVLWAGGEMLAHRRWCWHVLSLCRASDPDRAPRFRRVLERLGATGHIADLDDGPDQTPLPIEDVENAILAGLERADGESPEPGNPPAGHRCQNNSTAISRFDLVLTHAPMGEYERHRRHEEVSRAVIRLWRSGRLAARTLMLFAYEGINPTRPSRARRDAHVYNTLPEDCWRRKYALITEVYGFAAESWEARATPRQEAFWRFASPADLDGWLTHQGIDV